MAVPCSSKRRSWVTTISAWLGASIFAASCSGQAKELRILALGDSYTIGESVGESERWPIQLAAELRKRGRILAEPAIIAHTGWTTLELDAGMNRAKPQGPYDMVTLLIGVNDQFRGGSADAYRAPFRAMLARAIALAGGNPARVVVLSIPDWGVTPFAGAEHAEAIGKAIDQFNQVNREETAAAGCAYVDITPISREAKTNKELLAKDSLHPSGAMYRRWVEAALPAVEQLLGK